MFICDKCLVREYENRLPSVHTLRSYGRCEICKDNGPCNDMPSSALVPRELEFKQTPKEQKPVDDNPRTLMAELIELNPLLKSDPVFIYYMDLSVGDMFICLPTKDQDLGHGAFGEAQCIFVKIDKDDDGQSRAVNTKNGEIYCFPEETNIIKIKK